MTICSVDGLEGIFGGIFSAMKGSATKGKSCVLKLLVTGSPLECLCHCCVVLSFQEM